MSEHDWKQIALYLADCHAATAEYDGQLASVSRSRKNRLVSICHTAAEQIRGRDYNRARTEDDVLRRLDEIVEKLRATGPDTR